LKKKDQRSITEYLKKIETRTNTVFLPESVRADTIKPYQIPSPKIN